MVELRKRKATALPPVQSTKRTRAKVPASALKPTGNATASTSESILRVGDVVNLNGFGGDFETNDGRKTTLKILVDESKAGVVLFTYPKASTPGCTKQACLFRDGFDKLTSTGLAIYGLSADSPKANTNFKSRQSLPYPLLSDTASTLIGAIGFKKSPRGTIRGVFVIDKAGKVLLLQPGGPDATVEAVQQLVLSMPKEVQDGIAET